MLQNKNQYAKDLANLISQNVKKSKSINRKYGVGLTNIKVKPKVYNDEYYSSEDELKGRSVIQEIDY